MTEKYLFLDLEPDHPNCYTKKVKRDQYLLLILRDRFGKDIADIIRGFTPNIKAFVVNQFHYSNKYCRSILCHYRLSYINIKRSSRNKNEITSDIDRLMIPKELFEKYLVLKHGRVLTQLELKKKKILIDFSKICGYYINSIGIRDDPLLIELVEEFDDQDIIDDIQIIYYLDGFGHLDSYLDYVDKNTKEYLFIYYVNMDQAFSSYTKEVMTSSMLTMEEKHALIKWKIKDMELVL